MSFLTSTSSLCQCVQEILCIEDSSDIIQVFSDDRITGKLFLGDYVLDILCRHIQTDRNHPGGRHHDLFCRHIRELKDAMDEGLFRRLKYALLPAFPDQHFDLFLRDISPPCKSFSPERSEQQICAERQDLYKE